MGFITTLKGVILALLGLAASFDAIIRFVFTPNPPTGFIVVALIELVLGLALLSYGKKLQRSPY